MVLLKERQPFGTATLFGFFRVLVSRRGVATPPRHGSVFAFLHFYYTYIYIHDFSGCARVVLRKTSPTSVML